jgi:NACHT domain
MAERAEQQSTTSLPWWDRVCRAGWKVVRYFWAIFILTLVLPKAVDVLFSDKPLQSLPNLWPILQAIVHHPVWTLLTFLGLLLLTGLFWFGSRERATTTQGTLSEHDRSYLLRRLRLRYKQMLAQSLQGAVQVELGFASRPAAIQNAASLSLRLPEQWEQTLPPYTSILDVYEQAQQELLILGEPGAGKSTLLLELAHHLVERAEQQPEYSPPVLFPLSPWATTRRPLQDWLIEQFVFLYDVPRKLSQHWIEAELLLPLLDGLDEMDEAARPACIEAINTYHREHLGPLVVCSRTNGYDTAARHERLALHTAVVVQPLSPEQIDTHLANIGKPLAALRSAFKKNAMLAELATTPLMLQILMLTYHGIPVRRLSHQDVVLQQQVWTDYVQRMVTRKGDARRYPLDRTITWLGWLARCMRDHNQTIFFLQGLSPDWLPRRPRILYPWSMGLLVGLLGGLLFGLLGGLHVGQPDDPGLLYLMLVTFLPIELLAGVAVLLADKLVGRLIGKLGELLIGPIWDLPDKLDDALQPSLMRFWLARRGVFPWKAVPFLEDATARILLRRVGGGYSFIHRLLLDYFADLDTQASPTSTAGSSTKPIYP